MDVTCSISGIRFRVPGFNGASLPANRGYFHPIFASSYKQRYILYKQHVQNQLTATDSYLLFLAFLHSTDKITWNCPAACKPTDTSTIKLVQNNIRQLIAVNEMTYVIKHPGFKQPSFVVSYDNSRLIQIPNWIKAWQDNITAFNSSRAAIRYRQDLQKIENILESKLHAGTPLEKLPSIVANWAEQAAEFPAAKTTKYKAVIRSCFNDTKMFNTPLALIKEVQEYCYANIEPGSIHFHTLASILKTGAKKHLDYLGGSPLALGYTLLDTTDSSTTTNQLISGEIQTQAELDTIRAKAPMEAPTPAAYPDKLAYLKARLAYKVALQAAGSKPQPTPTLGK